MKSPAAYQIPCDLRGQRIALGHRGHCPVKRRVERRDLRKFGMRLGEGSDGADLERLVRGLDLFELFKLRDHRFVDQHRPWVSRAAV